MWHHPVIACLLLGPVACSLPRDPDGTSKRIAATHELRVGFSDNAPWTDGGGTEPQGIEPELVRAFAAKVGARVAWTRGSESTLAQALKHHELDLAIGGFDAKTPWKSIAGVSHPFTRTPDKKQHVLLTVPGENGFILTLDKFLVAHERASGAS